jgi:GTP-binding protein EngB required for normal cell division
LLTETLGSQYWRSAAPSAETGLHIVGHRVQVLVDAIQDFREFGVDHVVQLPELVLVGDQSAGKSSLMGALAEIHLPQSAGCCTRCPAHIKTTPAETWTCKISLEREYSYEPLSGRPIESKHVTKNNPFPPWNLQELEVKPFVTIREKSQLEEALKWAQIATLNHNKHHSLYIPGTDNFIGDETTEAKFSPNVVSVEISGPGLVPLSFYDLPGIFQNAGQKEDQYLVKVVENLALKYIGRPQALIICALPMSADPATSRTAKVIVDQNAASRCIGVLTKADQLQEGQSVAEFENMLKGIDYQLGHGYYVTKQPGHSSEHIPKENYHAIARTEEETFFSTKWPWSFEWSEFRSRFGTSNLAHALSQKFAAQIVKR